MYINRDKCKEMWANYKTARILLLCFHNKSVYGK